MTNDLEQQVKRAIETLTIQGYIERGRLHASSDTGELREAWPEALRTWLENRTDASGNAEEDIRAELLMRGIELSLDDAGEAGTKMLEEMKAQEPDFDKMARHPAMRELLAKMVEKPN